jgi:exopolyphosphatase
MFAGKVKEELFYLMSSGFEGKLVVCIGNEAGDLDSMVSALAAAYAYDQTQRGQSPILYIPVMPMLRSQFRLRQDASVLFSQAGFISDSLGAPVSLVFLDDPELTKLRHLGGKNQFVLTDHNMLEREREWFGSGATSVVGVIDHHKKEFSKSDLQARPKLIVDEGAASSCRYCHKFLLDTTQFVTHHWRNLPSPLSLVTVALFAKNNLPIPTDLRTLLLGTILVDTRNFDPVENRY